MPALKLRIFGILRGCDDGAGEMLVFSAADFEDFRVPRPDMPPQMENELEDVVRILVQNKWPWRLHATYDETISRALDVYEKVHRDTPLDGLHWFFDHAETISDQSIDRIAALGGGIAVQHRMGYQGEYFVERFPVPSRSRRISARSRRGSGRRRPSPSNSRVPPW
jgi:predicted amidohydrolase YtcJ